jgi:hypothetical protein
MGNYNPSVPIILGQEWVPIRDEDLVFSPSINVVEKGHGFTLLMPQVLQDGRFYIHTPAPALTSDQVNVVSVYSAGTEAATGPIESVIIPCNFGAVTGDSITFSGATVAASLLDPSDSLGINSTFSATFDTIGLWFATNSYAAALTNKRIVGVRFLYTAYAVNDNTGGPFINNQGTVPPTYCYINRDNVVAGFPIDYGPLNDTLYTSNPNQAPFITPLGQVSFGDVSQFWSTSPGDERLPWKYADLQRFEASAGATRLHVELLIQMQSNAGDRFFLGYAALQVFYCAETRLAYGAKRVSNNQIIGANAVTMRTATANTLNPVLAAGDYTVTLAAADIGDLNASTARISTYPELNALRELYDIPPHPGLQVNVTTTPGDTFTSEQTHILPQLSLHASGGPLTEPHAYGRQAAAEVYGANTATQEIYDDAIGVATVFPQVRFIARRYGDDSGTLTMTGGGSLGASSVSITSTDFDGLPEIIDGWKEITLRFDTPPTMGTLASPEPSWTWSAAAAIAGTRWEILAASAPALSGIASNLFNLVPSPHQLYTATYQPPAGSTVELTWMPQGVASPYVTGATADQATDAFLIFSQDPPTITGLEVTPQTQVVTGIGLDCGTEPCCIPTGISYQRLTWTPTTLPVSGFGAYELQRFDAHTDWQTIMSASSTLVTGFNDYEARVGIASVYRIRATNLYDFAGAWSTQVTGTVAAPGVAGCAVDGGTLIFTTNEDQTGASNLAYSPAWERSAEETFDFPEADQVTFQRMYNRDGSTAFHGTERGLEHFTRILVIQQAAIDPIRLANLRSLRDLAWADLSYVCVRDDIGDRWLSNIRVPGENVRQRALYLATVDITEVTQTASPVDPAA